MLPGSATHYCIAIEIQNSTQDGLMNDIATLQAQASASAQHVDVLIVGAGISGIAAAHHLGEQCPDKSFMLLETKESFGGTWRTHTYPGVRSDSDLCTFGYRFKPCGGGRCDTGLP
jgi:monooxygenase